MAKAGRAAQALATAAIGSFVAGTIGTAAARVRRAAGRASSRSASARPSTSRSCCSPSSASPPCSAAPGIRGFASLLLGLAIGLIGIDKVTGQPRLTFGTAAARRRHRRRRRRGRHLRRRRGALGRGTPAAQGRRASSRSAGRGWAARTGSARGSRGCAAPRFGFPFGALPAGGAEIPTFLSYIDREAALQAPRGVRQGRHRGRRRPGGRQQRLGRRHAGADADAGPADQRHGRDHAGRAPALRPPARAAAVREAAGPGVGA